MRYTPHTSADREQMLRAIGIDSIEALYQHVPATLQQRSKINLPEGISEFSVRQRLTRLASRNATPPEWSLFLGGGIYHHFIPSAVDAIISRAEFATSYTPYQPEVSQGTLQALFEYQTLICQLTGMEVSNAAVYDGASAAAEAVLMSRRMQPPKRRRVLISRALHPQYRAVVATYLRNLPGVELEEIPFAATGATEATEIARRVDDQSLCVVLGYPNFFGVIEDLGPAQAAWWSWDCCTIETTRWKSRKKPFFELIAKFAALKGVHRSTPGFIESPSTWRLISSGGKKGILSNFVKPCRARR